MTIEEARESHDRSIDPAPLPTVLPTDMPVEYHIVETGTKRGKPRLHDTEGFVYTVKKNTTTGTYWWCSIRQKGNVCPATVIQKGTTFIRGRHSHIHAGNPGALLQTKVRVRALEDAATQKHKSANLLAEDVIMELRSEGDHCLPKPANEARAVNRKRQKLRPPEPSSLDFEVCDIICIYFIHI